MQEAQPRPCFVVCHLVVPGLRLALVLYISVRAESAVMINMSPICPTKAFLYMVSLKKGSFSIFVLLAPKVLLDYL